MSGLEVVGAVAAAVALIELCGKCTIRLVQIKKARDDATARDLLKRTETLSDVLSDVTNVIRVLQDSSSDQRTTYRQHTDAESTIWTRMRSILLLCQKQLKHLHKQLCAACSKTEGLLSRTKETVRLSILIPNIKRIRDDIDTYIGALNLLKGLLQTLATHRYGLVQRDMHRDIREIRDNHGIKLDQAIQGICQIRDELRHRPCQLDRSNSGHSSDRTITPDDQVESLSVHLERILIAATDVKASIDDPMSRPPSASFSDRASRSLPNSSTVSNLAESISISSILSPPDSLPDITHIEPLKVLACRFKEQAVADYDHGHFQSAEIHQLASIKCFEELHDAHSIVFESYHEMKMMMVNIWRNLKKAKHARIVLERAQRGRLQYDSEPGSKTVTVDLDDDACGRALASEDLADLSLEMYQSGIEDMSLNDAERHAKHAFYLRREISGKDDPHLKGVVKLLVKIYSRDPNKTLYAEVYRDLYLSADSLSRSRCTSLASGCFPMLDSSQIIKAIKEHVVGDEESIRNLIDEGIHSNINLDEVIKGKSAMMAAIDCDCQRCDNVIDKLLRSGASRDVPFQYAVKSQKTAKCARLLRFDAKIDWLDADRMTPLMGAVKREHFEMVSFLLSNHANTNVPGSGGRTSLHVAVQTRNPQILRLLLEDADLDIDSQDCNGLTALHHCAKLGKRGLAKMLYHAGADLEIQDDSDKCRTALYIAVREAKYTFAETLIKFGAEVDMNYLPTVSGDMRNLLKKHCPG